MDQVGAPVKARTATKRTPYDTPPTSPQQPLEDFFDALNPPRIAYWTDLCTLYGVTGRSAKFKSEKEIETLIEGSYGKRYYTRVGEYVTRGNNPTLAVFRGTQLLGVIQIVVGGQPSYALLTYIRTNSLPFSVMLYVVLAVAQQRGLSRILYEGPGAYCLTRYGFKEDALRFVCDLAPPLPPPSELNNAPVYSKLFYDLYLCALPVISDNSFGLSVQTGYPLWSDEKTFAASVRKFMFAEFQQFEDEDSFVIKEGAECLILRCYGRVVAMMIVEFVDGAYDVLPIFTKRIEGGISIHEIHKWLFGLLLISLTRSATTGIISGHIYDDEGDLDAMERVVAQYGIDMRPGVGGMRFRRIRTWDPPTYAVLLYNFGTELWPKRIPPIVWPPGYERITVGATWMTTDHLKNWNPPAITDQTVTKAQKRDYVADTREFYNSLDDYDKFAVLRYIRAGIELNALWRSGTPLVGDWVRGDEEIKLKERLNYVATNAPALPFDLTVYRGLRPNDAINRRLPLRSFRDEGFISTTTDISQTAYFAADSDPFVLSIVLPKGSRHGFYIAAIWRGEAEFMLAAGLNLEFVISVSKTVGGLPVSAVYRVKKVTYEET